MEANKILSAIGKEISGELRILGETHGGAATFEDFLTVTAAALSNIADAGSHEERTKQFTTTMSKYSGKERLVLVRLFADLTAAFDKAQNAAGPYDILGEVAAELGLCAECCGQFFTPQLFQLWWLVWALVAI